MLQSNECIVKHKVGLLNLAEELSNVSKACNRMNPDQIAVLILAPDIS